MPQFLAKVKTQSGQTLSLERQSESQAACIRSLRAEGFVPMEVQESASRLRTGLFGGLSQASTHKPKRKQMQSFMSNFATLLRSGMDLERSLRTLEKEAAPPLRGLLSLLAERVRQGESLSAAMTQTEAFSPFHVSIIRAGEYGGNLSLALQRICRSIERELELRARIRNAVAYPAFLICFGLASLIVMMLFVLPKFLKIYQEMKADLPLVTSLLLKTSGLLQTHGIWIFPLLILIGAAGVQYLFRFRENLSADRFRMKIPLLGAIIQDIETALFLRTLGLLIQSGIPIVQSLQIYARIAGSAIFFKASLEIEKGVQMGRKLSGEMRRQGIFSETTLNLVAVGEESGQLDQLLLETSDGMEKRIDDLVQALLTILEPLLIIIVGIIIGLIVISMLLPIFNLSAAIRGR